MITFDDNRLLGYIYLYISDERYASAKKSIEEKKHCTPPSECGLRIRFATLSAARRNDDVGGRDGRVGEGVKKLKRKAKIGAKEMEG